MGTREAAHASVAIACIKSEGMVLLATICGCNSKKTCAACLHQGVHAREHQYVQYAQTPALPLTEQSHNLQFHAACGTPLPPARPKQSSTRMMSFSHASSANNCPQHTRIRAESNFFAASMPLISRLSLAMSSVFLVICCKQADEATENHNRDDLEFASRISRRAYHLKPLNSHV